MKHNIKKENVIILILSVILLIEMFCYIQREPTTSTFNINSTTKSEITDELVIALFMNNIIADSNTFYSNYFSSQLAYYNYEFKIKEISKQSGMPPYIYITFETTPMIGAHNPVGDDEITYKVDVFGNKTLDKFIHKKSYDIPPRLQGDMIKPLPKTNN